jgi:hypothetical protein
MMLRRHRAAHRAIWLALAFALPVLVIVGAYLRIRDTSGAAPVRLEAPR